MIELFDTKGLVVGYVMVNQIISILRSDLKPDDITLIVCTNARMYNTWLPLEQVAVSIADYRNSR